MAVQDTTVELHGHQIRIHSVLLRRWRTGQGIKMDFVHNHWFFESHFVLDGTLTSLMDGRPPTDEGAVMLLPPHSPHAWRLETPECIDLILTFTVLPIPEIVIPAAWPVSPEVLADLSHLLHEAEKGGAGWRDRMKAHLMLLFSHIFVLYNWPQVEREEFPTQERQFILEIDRFLYDHLASPISLEDVADHMHMSVSSLTRRYRRLTGMSLINQLMTFRLDEAANLLISTDLPIAEIARRVGFNSQAYFCRCYKARARGGLSPSEARQALRHPQEERSPRQARKPG
jgi:AraC-like DNA-binding protein